MKPNRPKVAIASIICALPCAVQILWALWLCFLTGRTRTVSEDLISLGLYALYLCPLALASVFLALLARGWRVPCLLLASVFFLGWLMVIVSENLRYKPKTIIGAARANNSIQQTEASRFAMNQIQPQWWLVPAADAKR